MIRRHGDITGRLLRLFGFNLDLCPVLDISFDDEADNSLRGRYYGRTVEEVVRNAGAFNDAMRYQGVASCGKHFPGYSAAIIDAHQELPRIGRTRDELEETELEIFAQLLSKLDSMMICHGWYPAFDREKTPASLSRKVVTDLLCGAMGFQGLIMTDDLDMGAIVNEYSTEEMIRLAIGAGNDLAMICHRQSELSAVHEVLGTLPDDQIERALGNVASFKEKMSPPLPFSEAAFRHVDQEIWDLRVAVLGEEAAAQRSPEDGKRSPVETY